jgi:DNA-binding NarL/FixJ family response regulator
MTKVAIVEDDRITRESLATIINLSPDCRCAGTCATAEEALKSIPELRPDVVLMDIQLPKMSGVDCVARLKELLPSVQVIMVTVYEDADRIFCALRAGASGYLLKRSTPDQVLGGIRDVLQGGVPMTGGIARKVIAHFQKQEGAAAEVESLSAREREVLDLVVSGLTSKEIGERLGVTLATVRWHLRKIYQSLHVHSRVDAVLKVHSRK